MLISILIPVYNTEKYLKECIESVCRQTIDDIEILLINDGSTDSSAEICRLFQKQDKRIKFFDGENRGVSHARNIGLKFAEGLYITFVDSDDVVKSNYCEFLLQKILESKADVVYGSSAMLYGKRIVYNKSRYKDGNYKIEEIAKKFIDDGKMRGFLLGGALCCLYKASIIKSHNLFFNENIKRNEDCLFNLEYVMQCHNICLARKNYIYYYRIHEKSTTQSSNNPIDFDEVNRILHLYSLKYPQYEFSRQLRARNISICLWKILWIYNAKISNKECISYIKQAIKSLKKEDFLAIDEKNLGIKIKPFYYAIKYKRVYLLYFMAKFIYPSLRKLISR